MSYVMRNSACPMWVDIFLLFLIYYSLGATMYNVFYILLILVLLIVSGYLMQCTWRRCFSHAVANIKGGWPRANKPTKKHRTGTSSKFHELSKDLVDFTGKRIYPDSLQHVIDIDHGSRALIIDVANMVPGWYMEHHDNKELTHNSQSKTMTTYRDMIIDHINNSEIHKEASSHKSKSSPSVQNKKVFYVIKNFKSSAGKSARIDKHTWNMFIDIVKKNPMAVIAVAQDYRNYPLAVWKNPKYHVLKGRDDHLCFHIAQRYKRNYSRAIIMSNDKFKDFSLLGQILPYTATYILNKSGKESSKSQANADLNVAASTVKIERELIVPGKNKL